MQSTLKCNCNGLLAASLDIEVCVMYVFSIFLTWRHQVSAAPGSCAGSPSWPSPPPVGAVSLPALCAGPPDSSSSARDAAGAAGTVGSKVRRSKIAQRQTTQIKT